MWETLNEKKLRNPDEDEEEKPDMNTISIELPTITDDSLAKDKSFMSYDNI